MQMREKQMAFIEREKHLSTKISSFFLVLMYAFTAIELKILLFSLFLLPFAFFLASDEPRALKSSQRKEESDSIKV